MSGTTSESSKRDVLKHAIGRKRTTALAAEPEHTQDTSARICDPALACFWLYATAVDFGYPSREARWIYPSGDQSQILSFTPVPVPVLESETPREQIRQWSKANDSASGRARAHPGRPRVNFDGRRGGPGGFCVPTGGSKPDPSLHAYACASARKQNA